MAHEELHISSLVVHSTPRRLEAVAEAIASLPGAMVHASSATGKLVVTLEVPTAEAMSQQVSTIQHIDGVLSAVLVYQCADNLDTMNEEVADA
ncbi:MAG TPA: chaperone NapD [Rubrivivax sp.]